MATVNFSPRLQLADPLLKFLERVANLFVGAQINHHRLEFGLVQNRGSVDFHHHRITDIAGYFRGFLGGCGKAVARRRYAVRVKDLDRLFADYCSVLTFQVLVDDLLHLFRIDLKGPDFADRFIQPFAISRDRAEGLGDRFRENVDRNAMFLEIFHRLGTFARAKETAQHGFVGLLQRSMDIDRYIHLVDRDRRNKDRHDRIITVIFLHRFERQPEFAVLLLRPPYPSDWRMTRWPR